MRVVPLFAACFCLAPVALAADWGTYENAGHGYVVGVPLGFAEVGQDDGAGRRYASADGTQRLRAWGAQGLDGGFEATVGAVMDATLAGGWALSSERVTPAWASWTGSRNGMRLEARMISLCGGGRYAAIEIVYPERALGTAGPVAERLAASLAAAQGGGRC